MDHEQAEATCDELRKLISLGPGKNDSALNKARDILSQCPRDANDCIREKASEVEHDFQLWVTPRRWKQFGEELSFRARLNGSVHTCGCAARSVATRRNRWSATSSNGSWMSFVMRQAGGTGNSRWE